MPVGIEAPPEISEGSFRARPALYSRRNYALRKIFQKLMQSRHILAQLRIAQQQTLEVSAVDAYAVT
jgi:hypothetical protein